MARAGTAASVALVFAVAACGGETVGSSRVFDGPGDATLASLDGARVRDAGRPASNGAGGSHARDGSARPPLSDAAPPVDGGGSRDASVDAAGNSMDSATPLDGTAAPAAVAYLDPNLLDVRIPLASGFEPTYLTVDVDGNPATRTNRTVILDVVGARYRFAVVLDPAYAIDADACSFLSLDGAAHQLRVLVPRAYVDAGHDGLLTVGVATDNPTIVPEVVDALPPFGGAPLCSAGLGDPGTIAPGAYVDLWAAEGFIATTRLCALTTAGDVKCWAQAGTALPTLPAGPFEELGALNAGGLCARRATGTVECWTIPSLATDRPPVPPPSGAFYARLSPTGPCAILENGDIRCWDDGRTDGGFTDRAGPYADVSGNGVVGCGVRAGGSVDCWGYDGDGSGAGPKVSLLGTGFKAVASTTWAVCALGGGGSVDCVIEGHTDIQVLYGEPFLRLTTGGSICALDAAGFATCLGRDSGIPSVRLTDLRVGEYTDPACGILLDGRLNCWLGDGLVFP